MASVEEVTEPGSRTDWLGILCSLGCAIHCAAMPILLTALPTLTAVKWMADPLFHQVVAVLCALIVGLAILPGWRVHRSRAVAGLAGAGIGLLFVAAFILPDQCCSGHEHSQSKSIWGYFSLGDSERASDDALSVQQVSADSSVHNHDHDDCVFCRRSHAHADTLSRPLFTAEQLESRLGVGTAGRLMAWQPFLSPIGGLLLILAHLVNIRLKIKGCGCHHAHA